MSVSVVGASDDDDDTAGSPCKEDAARAVGDDSDVAYACVCA